MDIGWKVLSTGAGILAGIAANKVLDVAWRAATGHEPPDAEDTEAHEILEIVVFAAVSGAVIGLTRQLFMRGAKKLYGNPIEKATA